MKQAMIFAAGLGTRLKPLTEMIPKALVQVGGKPLLGHAILRLRDVGYSRIVVNVHHFPSQIIDYLDGQKNFGIDIRISDESTELLETGGGIKKAREQFCVDSPVLIHNVDILDNVDYDWFSRQHLDEEDAVLLVSRRKTERYLLFDNAMRLMGWVNTGTGELKSPYEWIRSADKIEIDWEEMTCTLTDEPSPSMRHAASRTAHTYNLFAFSGIHSFSPRLFPLMDKFPNRFSIMDFYLQTCHRTRVYGCVREDVRILDVGKNGSLAQAEEFLKEIP